MTNPSRLGMMWTSLWGSIGNLIMHIGGLAVVGYGLALAERDLTLLRLVWAAWLGLYVLLAPIIPIGVARREVPGDPWRAAACLAYGFVPAPLILAPGANEWPWAAIVMPVTMAWGIAAWLNAVRDEPPVRSPRIRALILTGAAVITGLVCLPLFGGAVVGFMMGVWDPPAIAWLAAPVIVGLCLPLAIGTAYASVRLFAEARRAAASAPP